MKKKLLALIFAATLITLTACSNEPTETNSNSETNTTDSQAEDDTTSAGVIEDVVEDDGRKTTMESGERLDEIVIALASAANNLQPYSSHDAGILPITLVVYETLLEQQGLSDFTGRLAKEWYDVDDTHHNVELYDYITDSKGNNITAADVAFSYQIHVDSGFAVGDFDEYFLEAEAIDTYVVQFTWKKKIDSLTSYAAIMTVPNIVSEAEYNSGDFSNAPIGTGPYAVKEYITGAYTIVEANDNYWQTPELASSLAGQSVQTIRYDVVTDASMRLIALEQGTTSYCQLDSASLPNFLEGGKYDGQYTLASLYSVQNQNIIPNCSEHSIMNDLNLRLAIYYAIDAEAISIALGADMNLPCFTDAAPAIPDYNTDWDIPSDNYYHVYDLDLAKDYLEQSGYNGETITIMSGTFGIKKTQAEMIKTFLDDLGVNSELAIYENAVLLDYWPDPTKWDIAVFSQQSSNTVIEKWIREFGDTYGYAEDINVGFIEDEKLQEMLYRCFSTDGYSKELLNEINDYIIDNAYSYGTINTISYYAYDLCYATVVMNYTNQAVIPGACVYYLD